MSESSSNASDYPEDGTGKKNDKKKEVDDDEELDALLDGMFFFFILISNMVRASIMLYIHIAFCFRCFGRI